VPSIVSLLPLGFGYTRKVLIGLRRYLNLIPKWELRVLPSFTPAVLESKDHDAAGCIVLIVGQAQADTLRGVEQPVVNVSSRKEGDAFPGVHQDNAAIGQVAAKHLLDLGFERFAFAHEAGSFSADRCAGFRAEIEAAGYLVEELGRDFGSLHPRLLELPKPLGLMAANDLAAGRCLEICRRAGLRVPEDVAVVGVDNDEDVCEIAPVPLTSVDTAAETIGYKAGELLLSLIRGEPRPALPIVVPPVGIVRRASTAGVGVDDPVLAKALDYIHRHACDPLRVEDLMEQVHVSRRTLEIRFRKRFGRTLAEEISRIRLDRAKYLLTETELPVAKVMAACGYENVPRFITWFRRNVGVPPIAFRKKARGLA